jgi:hypothetical protein
MHEHELHDDVQEVKRLLHELVRQGRERHAQIERLIALIEGPGTFPQATGAQVSSP